jgi:hypothetical protein
VDSLTLHCLFRGHAGTAWFDDLSIEEVRPDSGASLFQGAPLRLLPRAASRATPRRLATKDGLEITLQDDRIDSLKLAGRECASPAASGFLARDVAAGSNLYAFRRGRCDELGLGIESDFEAREDHVRVRGRLLNPGGRERAVTLVFAIPLEARGWRWGHDARRSVPVDESREYANVVAVPCGATGTISRYPLGSVASDREGLAIAVDPDPPAQFRIAYHGDARQLLVAYDLGLPAGAETTGEFRFAVYRFDGRWGFRAAAAKLYSLFPTAYAARSLEHGIWMPFFDVEKVRGWQDFGFKYHEGDGHAAFDDAQGILSFRYGEPMSWWMPMPPESPRTEAEAERLLEERARSADGKGARAVLAAGMKRADGTRAVSFRKTPWCDGAVWSVNPNPRLHEPEPPVEGALDGAFLDSMEGWAAAELDHDPRHLPAGASLPSFTTDTKKPVLFKGQAAYERARAVAEELRPKGRLVFGNGVPHRFGFLCPWLDVLGTETNWFGDGTWQPASDEDMLHWRTMAFQKPYLLLLNTDFEKLTAADVERYFQRCLFYGMFPSMFSRNASDDSYWENPRWYDRDRPLFRKYVPLIRRAATAGWNPVTDAGSDNPRLFVERFGPDALGTMYVAVLNEQKGNERGRLTLPAKGGAVRIRELISGTEPAHDEEGVEVSLRPHEVWFLELRPVEP